MAELERLEPPKNGVENVTLCPASHIYYNFLSSFFNLLRSREAISYASTNNNNNMITACKSTTRRSYNYLRGRAGNRAQQRPHKNRVPADKFGLTWIHDFYTNSEPSRALPNKLPSQHISFKIMLPRVTPCAYFLATNQIIVIFNMMTSVCSLRPAFWPR